MAERQNPLNNTHTNAFNQLRNQNLPVAVAVYDIQENIPNTTETVYEAVSLSRREVNERLEVAVERLDRLNTAHGQANIVRAFMRNNLTQTQAEQRLRNERNQLRMEIREYQTHLNLRR